MIEKSSVGAGGFPRWACCVTWRLTCSGCSFSLTAGKRQKRPIGCYGFTGFFPGLTRAKSRQSWGHLCRCSSWHRQLFCSCLLAGRCGLGAHCQQKTLSLTKFRSACVHSVHQDTVCSSSAQSQIRNTMQRGCGLANSWVKGVCWAAAPTLRLYIHNGYRGAGKWGRRGGIGLEITSLPRPQKAFNPLLDNFHASCKIRSQLFFFPQWQIPSSSTLPSTALRMSTIQATLICIS